MTATFLHTMVRITDPDRSRAFYEALGFTFERDMDIVRNGEKEATNYFFSLGRRRSVLELTYNHDGRTYDLGTGYGHIAVGVDDLDGTLARLGEQGIEPERAPYQVREGGSLALLRPRPRRLSHRAHRPLTFTLAQLEEAIRGAWSEDTAEEDDGWTPENPSRGQCDITTLVVQDLLGGEVLAADVFLDGVRIEAHMWNRLPQASRST